MRARRARGLGDRAGAARPGPGRRADPGKVRDLPRDRARHARAIVAPGVGRDDARHGAARDSPHAGREKDDHRLPRDLYGREAPSPAAQAASAQAAAAQASDPVTQLLNRNACLGCHAVDRRVIGPGFREVAARYQVDAAAAPKLAKKIKDGGQGAWGQVPMPPNPGLSEADLKLLVDWVLAQL